MIHYYVRVINFLLLLLTIIIQQHLLINLETFVAGGGHNRGTSESRSQDTSSTPSWASAVQKLQADCSHPCVSTTAQYDLVKSIPLRYLTFRLGKQPALRPLC